MEKGQVSDAYSLLEVAGLPSDSGFDPALREVPSVVGARGTFGLTEIRVEDDAWPPPSVLLVPSG